MVIGAIVGWLIGMSLGSYVMCKVKVKVILHNTLVNHDKNDLSKLFLFCKN